ncbi:YaiI/YqxD family protein [Spongiibacter taiwanensis]|uniref:YaiI/YqxD family protein n=1 Tax=Spongiibacter taiwanensis TaxID=1748242 RepID=UPI00203529E7|nr:YaiI/YqxD family protein [Spongiibacter taiwanensis]USA42197.1 YaiI/YqxD family protein [Spongiibacter taiwanensis]
MQIWVDADACPVVVREILFKAAQRTGVSLTFVANQMVRVPPVANIRSLQVSSGFDVADNEIVRRTEKGDLVITSDIPLAAEVIAKGALALNPRGELYTADTVRSKLNIRDFMDTMRSSGVHTGGSAAYGQREKQAFANQLDRYLARLPKG